MWAQNHGDRVHLNYDYAADALRIRLLEIPVTEAEEIDSNAVIGWSSDGRIVTFEVFGLAIFFAGSALQHLLEELDALNLVSSPIIVSRGRPEHGGGYIAWVSQPGNVTSGGATPVDAIRSMLKTHQERSTA
jgi:uncharacterized protein YuzE